MARRVVYLPTPVADQKESWPAGGSIVVDRDCLSEFQSGGEISPTIVFGAGPDTARVILAARTQDTVFRITAGTLVNTGSVRQEWDVLVRAGVEIESAARNELPLFARRVLVMRPAGREVGLVARLKELGAVPVSSPALDILAPLGWHSMDEAITRLPDSSWIVFASIHGVEAFLGRLRDTGQDLAGLARSKIAAVGPATAHALQLAGIRVDFVPAVHSAEGLVTELEPLLHGDSLLIIRADRGRDTLEKALGKVAHVQSVIAYRQVDRELLPDVAEWLTRGLIDYALMTSSNTARVLARAFQGKESRLGQVGVVALSSITAEVCRELGLNLIGISSEASDEGLISELVQIRSRSAFQPR